MPRRGVDARRLATTGPSCPRALLQRVVAAYAERGLTPIVAPELEFFLVERDRTEDGGLRRYVDELSRVYTVGAVSDPREVVLRMLLWCDELGLEAFAANHEFMNSQYEINVKHSQALDAADRAFMLKAAVKEIAAREGLLATFMGRPFGDQGGSGFHLHISLGDADGGERVRGRRGPDGLSPLAASFVAGILEHAPGLQALLGPTVNAYKRILPDSLAPTHGNWGHDNRTAMCRVPLERGAALAGRDPDGRRRGVRPPDHGGAPRSRASTGSSASSSRPSPSSATPTAWTTRTRARGSRPTSAPRSTRSRRDAWLTERLGPELVATFLAMKRFEVERFGEAVGELDPEVVTAWEVEEYAAHL